MAAYLPDGATVSLATSYSAPKVITGISNANPGVATFATGHGIVQGDIFQLTSGWSGLNERMIKAGLPVADAIPLTGMNTTDVSRFPVGTGAGTAREVATFTQISQILSFETSGGEASSVIFSYLDEDFERSLPSVTSAQTIKIGIADDDTLAGYIALNDASNDRTLRALKLTLRNGSIILYTGIVSFNITPTVTKGEVMQVTATFALQARPVRYNAA
jgi:hypothetical protein